MEWVLRRLKRLLTLLGTRLVIGIIPDGNRTWCLKRGIQDLAEGYIRGARVGIQIIQEAITLGYASHLVFFALSREDMEKRPLEQIQAMIRGLDRFLDDVEKIEGVRVVFYGDLSHPVLEGILRRSSQIKQSGEENLQVVLLVNYSRDWDFNGVPPRTAEIPEINFVVRTNDRHSLSGFLIWQAYYAELYPHRGLWPSGGMRAFRSSIIRYTEYLERRMKKGGRGA